MPVRIFILFNCQTAVDVDKSTETQVSKTVVLLSNLCYNINIILTQRF